MAQRAEFSVHPFAEKPANRQGSDVIELFRSNDPVLISFAVALLKEAGIEHTLLDQNMSVIEGSLGILPRRMLVDAGRIDDARRILAEAGLEAELK